MRISSFGTENFGKLCLRLVVGLLLTAQGIAFFAGNNDGLFLLTKLSKLARFPINPTFIGMGMAGICVLCGITFALGAFFRTSSFLLGSALLVRAALKYFGGSSIVDEIACVAMVSATMYAFVFIGSGSFSVQR